MQEVVFDEFIASAAQLMLLEHRHGSFDDVESPTGKPVFVGNERKEEVKSELCGFEVFDPLLGSKSMVESRKVAWDWSYAIGNDGIAATWQCY